MREDFYSRLLIEKTEELMSPGCKSEPRHEIKRKFKDALGSVAAVSMKNDVNSTKPDDPNAVACMGFK
jgi:hypothetical protein